MPLVPRTISGAARIRELGYSSAILKFRHRRAPKSGWKWLGEEKPRPNEKYGRCESWKERAPHISSTLANLTEQAPGHYTVCLEGLILELAWVTSEICTKTELVDNMSEVGQASH